MSVGQIAAPEQPSTAAELLSEYTVQDVLLSSPRRQLLGRGSQARLRGTVPRADLARHASLAALSDAVAGGPGVVLGAVPFSEGYPARLVVPEQLRSITGAHRPGPRGARPRRTTGWHTAPVPSKSTYARTVGDALRRIDAGELEKVVLARALDIDFDAPIDVPELLRTLLAHDSDGYGYAVPLEDGRVFLGSSPELLVARHGTQVLARPLAGSAARSSDPAEDGRRACALSESAKDLREHALVTRALVASLQPHCTDITLAPAPMVVSTATMWHLATPITATLRDPDTTSLELALAVHPTPAVCGTPTQAAYAAIAELEPFERGLFAGAVGWLDADGDGEWAVAIRCAEVAPNTARLFSGAGIVAGSAPQSEAAETGAKFRTMLHALGIEFDG